MTDVFLGIAALLWAIDKAKKSSEEPTDESPDTGGRDDEDDSSQPPVAIAPTLPPYNLEPVWANDDDTVCIYIFQMLQGMVYEDPATGERTGEHFYVDSGYVIGNCIPNAFVRASASVGGTMTFTIDEVQYENVIIYATLEGAILEVEDDEEDSPDDPQQEPEDDGNDTAPSFPSRPDFGFGGGTSAF